MALGAWLTAIADGTHSSQRSSHTYDCDRDVEAPVERFRWNHFFPSFFFLCLFGNFSSAIRSVSVQGKGVSSANTYNRSSICCAVTFGRKCNGRPALSLPLFRLRVQGNIWFPTLKFRQRNCIELWISTNGNLFAFFYLWFLTSAAENRFANQTIEWLHPINQSILAMEEIE